MIKQFELFIEHEIVPYMVPSVNYGGCGLFAKYVYRQLSTYSNELNISNLEILLVCSRKQVNLNHIRSFVPKSKLHIADSWEEAAREYNGIYLDLLKHILVSFEYNGALYIVDGVYGLMRKHKYALFHSVQYHEGSITFEELSSFVKHRPNWNETFDRVAHAQPMKKHIKESFKTFTNKLIEENTKCVNLLNELN